MADQLNGHSLTPIPEGVKPLRAREKKNQYYREVWYPKNRARKAAVGQAWNEKNREKKRDYVRKARAKLKAKEGKQYRVRILRQNLHQVYKITIEQRDALFAANNGMCLICNSAPSETIDHCHSTGKIRGALCRTCNLGLGYFKDNIEFLEAAKTYLKETK